MHSIFYREQVCGNINCKTCQHLEIFLICLKTHSLLVKIIFVFLHMAIAVVMLLNEDPIFIFAIIKQYDKYTL